MDLQFFIDDQSLQTLCFHYILNNKQKSKTLIINSLLLKLVSTPQVDLYKLFKICIGIVEENKTQNNSRSMTDKQYNKNMATLLKQVIVKYPKIINTINQQQLCIILRYACEEVLCAVAALMVLRIQQHSHTVMDIVQKMVLNPKMLVASYRQVTRLQLYWLLLRVLSDKTQAQLNSEYIVQAQKDPRNISCVFQIYQQLLNTSSPTAIKSVYKQIFDNLQAYYPIDFEGDASQHNIQLRDISSLLDRCLAHPVFSTQTRALLMVKMGAAPIGKYIPTLILTRTHAVTPDAVLFWQNLLLRTSESQYMQQQYQQHAQYTLADLQIQLLNRLWPRGSALALQSYRCITEWMQKWIVARILDNEQNSKYAGFIITSLKKIMSKCNTNIQYILASYCIHAFLSHYKDNGDIVYKLGILVPILQYIHSCNSTCMDIDIDTQKIGVYVYIIQLLILTLSQLFHTCTQPQPKLIILKLYMLLANNHIYAKMIAQTNILHTCLQIINTNSNMDNKIIKGYIDFIAQLYACNQLVIDSIAKYNKIDIQIYGIIALANKNTQMYIKLAQLLQQQQHRQQVYKQLINILKILNIQTILHTIAYVPQTISQQYAHTIINIVTDKYPCTSQEQHNVLNYMTSNIMIYFTKHIWRPYLNNQVYRNTIRNKIISWINANNNNNNNNNNNSNTDTNNNNNNNSNNTNNNVNKYCAISSAYYNKSISAFALPQDSKIHHQAVLSSQHYHQQLYRMLPIQYHHTYLGHECKQWPTLTHYAWTNSHSLRHDLIEYLPNSILVSQSHRILPIILQNQDISTTSKILHNLPSTTISTLIIPFTITYLTQIQHSTPVQHIVALNKILYDIHSLAKQHQDIKATLVQNKGKVLVAIQDQLLQHRKRRARQSSRLIFSIYNTLK